jgi:hypothetical protein
MAQNFVFCFTGGLATMTRKRAWELVLQAGAKYKSSVTKDVNVIVSNINESKKMMIAKQAGKAIWSESEFLVFLHKNNVYNNKFVVRIPSKSPSRNANKSPARKASKSPARKANKSPARKANKSPARKANKSPARKASKSPARKANKSPARKASKSPARIQNNSPAKKASKSPARIQNNSPARKASKSPARKEKTKNNCTECCANTLNHLKLASMQINFCPGGCSSCKDAKKYIQEAETSLLKCCDYTEKMQTKSTSPKKGRGRPKKI